MIAEAIIPYEELLTLRRAAAGTTTLGRFTPGAAVESDLLAAVVPSTGRDLARLPEGMRTREVIRLLLRTELLTEPVPDEVVRGGATYEVQNVQPWTQGGFWDALAVRKEAA